MASHAAINHFLFRLIYWQRRARIQTDDGPRWIAKTYEEWAEDLGCTSRHVKRLVKTLLEAGAIDCKIMPFRRHTTLHLRVTKCHSNGGQDVTPMGDKMSLPTYIQEEYRKLYIAKKEDDLTVLGAGSKGSKASPPGTVKSKDPRPGLIIETWRGSWNDAYPGEKPDGISTSTVEKKNISIWCNEVEIETGDSDLPVALVRKAFQGWDGFVKEVQEKFFYAGSQG